MRFEYYGESIANLPKLSVDGIVPNSIHFSHWEGNETDVSIKADTSTEIALNLVAAPNYFELTRNLELVTNNHFDTDGVLSVWTTLTGERALEYRDELIAAAAAGDFSEFTGEEAVRVSLTIQGSDAPLPDEDSSSPLARMLAEKNRVDDEEAYTLILPEVEKVLRNVNDYEPLWRASWSRIERALESFAKGESKVEEDEAAKCSLITLAPEVFSKTGFHPTRHTSSSTAISHYARGNIFLIATPFENGWCYRADYPYYSWAETVVRPRIERKDFSALMARLNEIEKNERATWKIVSSELSSAFRFVDENNTLAASLLTPDVVAIELKAALDRSQATKGAAT